MLSRCLTHCAWQVYILEVAAAAAAADEANFLTKWYLLASSICRFVSAQQWESWIMKVRKMSRRIREEAFTADGDQSKGGWLAMRWRGKGGNPKQKMAPLCKQAFFFLSFCWPIYDSNYIPRGL